MIITDIGNIITNTLRYRLIAYVFKNQLLSEIHKAKKNEIDFGRIHVRKVRVK